MPSFDIVSKIDHQSLDNAINNARKEILNRYDFHGSKTEIELDKKAQIIHITTENDLRIKHIIDSIIGRMVKQQLDPACLDAGKEHYASGHMVRKDITVKEGIDRDTAKKIISLIKDSKLKVQASIMEDQVRVQSKQIDDLQTVIALMRQHSTNLGLPLQYVNMKS